MYKCRLCQPEQFQVGEYKMALQKAYTSKIEVAEVVKTCTS